MDQESHNPKSPSRDELPPSLLEAKFIPIGQYNPVELATLAARPSKTVPLIKTPASCRNPNACENLAQYKGRTPEGNRKAIANLRRNVSSQMIVVDPPQLPAGMPAPTIPTAPAPPRLMDAFKTKYLKSVLSKEEFDLFLHTWKKWIEEHSDYNIAEDEKDLETVCMEEVLQWRINLARPRRPRHDFSNEYNQSHLRQQRARDNLAARRDMRLGIGAKGQGGGKGNTTNLTIAVMAGGVDQVKIAAMEQKARLVTQGDMKFLEDTRDGGQQMIEAELTEPSVPAAEEVVGEPEVNENEEHDDEEETDHVGT